MMFGYLYVWSASIWLPIAVHFINNAAATVLYYFVGLGSLPNSTESFGEIDGQWGIGLASIIAASALAWLIKLETKKSLNSISNQSAA
jgi:membrane protease YdiL (CAAX protease family)